MTRSLTRTRERADLRSRAIHASILAVLFLCLFGGCRSGGGYVPITDPTERIDVVLASVRSPGGSGWHVSRQHQGNVSLGKLGSSDGQSFSGLVVLSRLPILNSKEEFRDLVSRQRARDSGDARYEDILNDETVSIENGIWVTRFHMKYKDFGAINRQPELPYLIVEDYGAVYQHPYHKDVAVTVALSQRATPEELDATFEQLAETFLKSVEFVREPPQ